MVSEILKELLQPRHMAMLFCVTRKFETELRIRNALKYLKIRFGRGNSTSDNFASGSRWSTEPKPLKVSSFPRLTSFFLSFHSLCLSHSRTLAVSYNCSVHTMASEKMAKRSIASLMRKKLSDITNSDSLGQPNSPCIQQLLEERTSLVQLIAERDEMIELNGAELRRLQAEFMKLQQQNWNLAQSNSLMLAEINSGRERIKTLQHEISWRAALLKGKSSNAQERVDNCNEKNASLSQSQVPEVKEGDAKAGKPSIKASNDEQQSHMSNRRHIRSKSIGSATNSKSKDMVKDNRRSLRRHSVTFKTHDHEPLENLFEIEDAIMLNSLAVKDGTRENFTSRNEAPRSSFGRPLRKAAEKVQTYKEIPVNVKMRRLE